MWDLPILKRLRTSALSCITLSPHSPGRYLVVWNPLIFMALSFAFHFMAPPSVAHDPEGHGLQQQLHAPGNVTLGAHAALVAGTPGNATLVGHATNGTLPSPLGLMLSVPPGVNGTA